MEAQQVVSRRNAPYGEFAFDVAKTYIWYIFSLTLLQVLLFDNSFLPRLFVVVTSGTISWFTTVFYDSNKLGYGMRGWSNFKQATEPKLVLAILCWPIFLIWLVTWPFCKVYSIARVKKTDTPDQ